MKLKKSLLFGLLAVCCGSGLFYACSTGSSASEDEDDNSGTVLPPDQGGGSDEISVAPANHTFPAAGGEIQIEITCEGDWHLVPSDGWFRFEPQYGTGNATVRVTADANYTEEFLYGVLEAVNAYSGMTAQFEVFQEASEPQPVVELSVRSDYFAYGDAVGLFLVNRTGEGASAPLPDLSSNQVNNVRFETNGYDGWFADETAYWKDAETAADAYLYYPWAERSGDDPAAWPFSASTDQNYLEDFRASCFLYGHEANVVPGSLLTITPVMLSAEVRAEIVIDEAVRDVYEITGVTFGGLCPEGTADLNEGRLTAAGEPADIQARLSSESAQGCEAAAAVPPQSADRLLLTVSYRDRTAGIGTKTREYFLRDLQLESGKSYRFSVVLDKDTDPVEIGGVQVKEWGEGGSFDLDFE